MLCFQLDNWCKIAEQQNFFFLMYAVSSIQLNVQKFYALDLECTIEIYENGY